MARQPLEQNGLPFARMRRPARIVEWLSNRDRVNAKAMCNTNRRRQPVMAYGVSMTSLNPTTDDFAAMLDEAFGGSEMQEGSVVKGTVIAFEKDLAVIDVGLKVEGRVPLKEFGAKARDGTLNIGDEVEVYLERVENALGEAVLSRDKARREESWVRLEVSFDKATRSPATSSTRSRAASPSTWMAPWPSCRAARLTSARFATSPADAHAAAVPDPENGQAPRQHRRFPPRRPGRNPRRTALRTRPEPGRGSDRRRRRQEHHRLRCVRRSRRYRWPAARHRHRVAPHQPSDGESCPSARRSRCRSSASTRKPTASRSA